MQKILSKNSYRYREIVKKTEKIDRLLIGRKFYDIRDHGGHYKILLARVVCSSS